MVSIRDDLYGKALRLWNATPEKPGHGYGPAGTLYRLKGDGGEGEYWAYFRDNLFAVNAFDMTFACSGAMRYRHTEFLCVTYYDLVSLFAQNSRCKPRAGAICTYLADEGAEYVATFKSGSAVRATSITISPDYYRDYLQARFGAIPDVRRAFALVDGRQDLPELVALLKQVRTYQGRGVAADLFYEGAVAETMALVIERAADLEDTRVAGDGVRISPEDRASLEGLSAYIRENPGANLSCEELARRSCMGQTKLKTAFKTMFGTSPASYVAQARIEGARDLLATTDLPISQIAHAMGYRKPGAFAEAFRRRTGVAPSAFRWRSR